MNKDWLPLIISLGIVFIIVSYTIVVPYRENMGTAKRMNSYNIDSFFNRWVSNDRYCSISNDSLEFYFDICFDFQPKHVRFQILQNEKVIYDGDYKDEIKTCKYNEKYCNLSFNLYDSISNEYYSWDKKESYSITNKSNIYIKFDEMSDYLIKFYKYWFYF